MDDLTDEELEQLSKLDGPVPARPVLLSPTVQQYAIRAVAEIRRYRNRTLTVKERAILFTALSYKPLRDMLVRDGYSEDDIDGIYRKIVNP